MAAFTTEDTTHSGAYFTTHTDASVTTCEELGARLKNKRMVITREKIKGLITSIIKALFFRYYYRTITIKQEIERGIRLQTNSEQIDKN